MPALLDLSPVTSIGVSSQKTEDYAEAKTSPEGDGVNSQRVPSPSDMEDYVANYFNSQHKGTAQEVIRSKN